MKLSSVQPHRWRPWHWRPWHWRPWQRTERASPDEIVSHLPAHSQAAQRRWLGLFRSRHTGPRPEAESAVLGLARDWITARGGRIQQGDSDALSGVLPDGTTARYTSAPTSDGQHADFALVVPGAPAWDALLLAVVRDGAGQALQLPTGPSAAAPLAQRALVPPAPGCEVCQRGVHDPDPEQVLCARCPLRLGRFVVVNAPAGVRSGKVVERTERRTLEAAVHLSVRSRQGVRDELDRLVYDDATGSRLTPVDLPTLQRASAVEHDHASEGDLLAFQQFAGADLRHAADAAGRLARLQSLDDYRRRQDDVTATQDRLLVESPVAGRDILHARERELRYLAERYAVTAEARLLSLTPVHEPLALVRVRLAGGGDVDVHVDLSRGRVEAPRCQSCHEIWHIGARCAEGHVTCLSCQERCAHCGLRRCAQCAAEPFAVCDVCAGASCARCARDTRRGRHRAAPTAAAPLLAPPPRARRQALASEAQRADATTDTLGGVGARALHVRHLDQMTAPTWRTFIQWFMRTSGYQIERAGPAEAVYQSFECRPAHAAKDAGSDPGPARDRPLVVVAYQAFADAEPATAALEAALAEINSLRARAPHARGMLLTTAPLSRFQDAVAGASELEIIDRDALARHLDALEDAHQHHQADVGSQTEARALAARAVRTTIHDGVQAAAGRLGGSAHAGTSPLALADAVQQVEHKARVVLQVLVAMEEEWAATFAPAPGRDGGLVITAGREVFDEQRARAAHLAEALLVATDELIVLPRGAARSFNAWRAAALDELQQRCVMLSARCQSVDPGQWHDFEAAHDPAATERSAVASAASRRAELRARRLKEDLRTT